MKTRYIIPFLLWSFPMWAQALIKEQANEIAAQGQEAYASGDHTRALQLFDSVNTMWSSAGLLHNIGNCHYKLGDVPRAILHYERALRLAPGSADISENLEHARQLVVDRLNEQAGFTFGATWGRFRGGDDPDAWARRSLLATFSLFLVLACALLIGHRGWRGAFFGLSGVLFLFVLVSVVFASMRYNEVTDDSAAILLAPKVDVRGEPREGATVLFILHKGSKVKVLQERNDWYEVQLPNGNVGWMPAGSLERI